ncbi:hypothetical protein NA78x_000414 [Anatilimnocola sp. NA78]|uniref:hypothetical protein n=1 Tax=Anatilimnocola sp. NA78 TaxID=3415683 RepID=UPI003CE59DB2
MFLAQSSATDISNPIWPTVAIAVGATLICLVGFLLLLFRQIRVSRQLLHTERIRSLEAGIPIEPAEGARMQAKFLHNAFWISFWLVFGVPSAAFSAASTATPSSKTLALSIVIWVAATVASTAAVICAIILMINAGARQTSDTSGPPKFPKLG